MELDAADRGPVCTTGEARPTHRSCCSTHVFDEPNEPQNPPKVVGANERPTLSRLSMDVSGTVGEFHRLWQRIRNSAAWKYTISPGQSVGKVYTQSLRKEHKSSVQPFGTWPFGTPRSRQNTKKHRTFGLSTTPRFCVMLSGSRHEA